MEINLSVIIPVFNEILTIEELLKRVLSQDIVKEIIVVDDYSTDGTRKYLESMKTSGRNDSSGKSVSILFHERNKGKGAAIRTGISAVTGNVVLIQDGDLEYDPKEYRKLLEPISKGLADVVYGSRFMGGPHRVLFFWHYVGNKILTTISNMLNDLNLSDSETCYKVFRTEIIRDIPLRSTRCGFESEITA